MRFSTGLTLTVMLFAAATAASAQNAADTTAKPIDRAGGTAATPGAPGAVVPDTPGVAVAPGIQAPVETPVDPAKQPKGGAAAGK